MEKGVIIRAPFYKVSTKGDDWRLEVLGAPYGGHVNGKDAEGEYFSPRTDFMMDVGDTRPAIYYHGLSPDGKQSNPEMIGTARAIRRDEQGLWFEVILDKTKELARRIWDAAQRGIARASSGAVNYLVRREQDGELMKWPIGELSLIDAAGPRQPANQLAVAQLKSLYDEAGLLMPEAFTQDEESKVSAVDGSLESNGTEKPINHEVKTMSEEKKFDEAYLEQLVNLATERLEAKAKEEAEAQERDAKIAEEAYKKGLEEGEAKGKNWAEQKTAPAVIDKEKLGMGEEAHEADFEHWLITGDPGAAKGLERPGKAWDGRSIDVDSRKTMNITTAADGEYLAPDGFAQNYIEQREQASFVRQMGVQVFQTSNKVFDIPAESTAMTKFVRTAESGTYDSNDPAVAQNQVTLQKWTKAVYITEEFMTDQKSNFMTKFPSMIGRAAGITENYYVAIGSGSNQHEGIFTGGDTDALTFNSDGGADSDGVLTPDALHLLYYTLAQPYRQNAVWLMDDITEKNFLTQTMTSTKPDWVFSAADYATFQDGKVTFLGRPSYTQDDIPVKSAGVCFIMFGDPYYYALVEGAGLAIRRNPWDRQYKGEVSFYCSFRQSGKVLVESAWVGGVGA